LCESSLLGDPESTLAGTGKETDVTIAGSALTPDIDAARWPDIAVVPHSPVRAAIGRRLFHRVVVRIPLRVVEPSGRIYGGGSSKDPVFQLVRPAAFYQRIGASGSIGFGEAYMAGDWTADDLSGVLCTFAAHLRDVVPAALQRLRAVALRRPPVSEDNTVAGARRNIQRHYDLSNDMFKVFLDESMTYSAALYNGDPADSCDELVTAQRRKVDRLLDASQVHAGTRVLEIGTGWGELAIRAASRGADVTSITNSAEQAALARERIARAGLADRATVLLQDYRAMTGRFDAVVSIEMVEAVGMNYWPDYFQTIDRALVPGGRAGLQAILQADDLMRATANTYTWIRKYIFPGGALMSAEALQDTITRHTGLHVLDRYSFGQHYAETLRRWRANFEARSADIARLGFDETFRRMWSFYLAYSESGFRTGCLDVSQICLAKPVRGALA
jgi:cyclopropane-fatty-acyl-phospholipid synthase